MTVGSIWAHDHDGVRYSLYPLDVTDGTHSLRRHNREGSAIPSVLVRISDGKARQLVQSGSNADVPKTVLERLEKWMVRV